MRFPAVLLLCVLPAAAQGNRADRLEWFRDQGFGMFIHWSVDSQLGSVISHSMVGAADDYLKRFIFELPKTFNPRKFHPQDWAVLAKLAGMRYVVFTAKHHAGFCMFDTATTDFNVMRTPFGRDITAEVLQAFRKQGVAPGLYFSPDDFWWLYRNGKALQRHVPEVAPANNPGLMKHDQAQVRELLTRYGDIDVVFFDGPAEGLRELAWDLRPEIVVTRGAMETPEQHIPGVPLEGAWEACLTMGTQWQYKPTNESYKSGGELIGILIETRAKGGNLLLNVGPKPDGELPLEQEERLREIALWMFLNGEAIYSVRPWVVTNEGEVWFTKKKDDDTVFAIVKTRERWKYGEWRDLVLRSVAANAKTEISVLGQNDRVLEYQPSVVPKTTWKQAPDGLHIRAMHAQRIYNDRKWPNPIVLKITHAKPALEPPRARTVRARWDAASRVTVLEGEIDNLGKAAAVEAGFEFRSVKGLDLTERPEAWRATPLVKRSAAGPYSVRVEGWARGDVYEFRAVVKHPLLTVYGKETRFEVR
jgi:alpha-L-fucosidase